MGKAGCTAKGTNEPDDDAAAAATAAVAARVTALEQQLSSPAAPRLPPPPPPPPAATPSPVAAPPAAPPAFDDLERRVTQLEHDHTALKARFNAQSDILHNHELDIQQYQEVIGDILGRIEVLERAQAPNF